MSNNVASGVNTADTVATNGASPLRVDSNGNLKTAAQGSTTVTGTVITGADPTPGHFAVTKADADFPGDAVASALWIGGAGDVWVRGPDDVADVLYASVPAATILPGEFVRVATATTATAITAWRKRGT